MYRGDNLSYLNIKSKAIVASASLMRLWEFINYFALSLIDILIACSIFFSNTYLFLYEVGGAYDYNIIPFNFCTIAITQTIESGN